MLSNMVPCVTDFNRQLYFSTEQAYQFTKARKSGDQRVVTNICQLCSPYHGFDAKLVCGELRVSCLQAKES